MDATDDAVRAVAVLLRREPASLRADGVAEEDVESFAREIVLLLSPSARHFFAAWARRRSS